jgi:LysR family pca operon transcriptional activator
MPPRLPATAAGALARIRLRHLQTFLAVAQLGTLRRAAQAMSVTQPAVTKTIKELEDLLGTPLFVRGRHGATLTAEADVFLRHAHASLQALGQAVDSVVEGPTEAPLRVGVLPTLAPSLMACVLRALAVERPGLTVRVHTGRNQELIDLLRQRELDVVLGRLSDPDAMLGVSFEPLFTEPLVIALRRGHPFLSRRTRRRAPGELAAWPLVLPLAGTMIRQVADGFLASQGLTPGAGLVETLDTALARILVLRDDHVWLTPLDAALPDIESGEMARLTLSITPEEPVGLMLPIDALPSPALNALRAVARREAAGRRRPTATKKRGVSKAGRKSTGRT